MAGRQAAARSLCWRMYSSPSRAPIVSSSRGEVSRGLSRTGLSSIDVALAQSKLFVDEAQTHRLEIVETAETGDALDAPRHDIRIGQKADRQVPARRMPGDVNLLRIAAIVANVRVHPGDRGAALADLVVHAHTGDQRVVDDDVDEPCAGEPERDVGAIFLVVADPVAAMNVNLHGRKAARLLRAGKYRAVSPEPAS